MKKLLFAFCVALAATAFSETASELGVPGDGRADAVAPLHAAFARGVRVVTFGKGDYRLDQTLRLPSGTKLVAAPDAHFFAAPHLCVEWVVCNADLEAGNADITVDGGAWDGNCDERPGKTFDPNEKHAGVFFHFRKVKGLVVRNLRAYDSVAYHFSLSRVTDFAFSNIRLGGDLKPFCQDGIHMGGGCERGRLEGIVAHTGGMGDDLIALNADDVYRYAWNRGQVDAPIRDITVENVVASNCFTVVRILSVHSPIERITFRNVTAGYRCHGINLDAARYCMHPLFKDASCPRGVGCLKDILFENCDLWCAGGDREVVTYETNSENVRFRNFRYRSDLDCGKRTDRPVIRLRKMEETVVTDGGQRLTVPCGGNWSAVRDVLADVRVDTVRPKLRTLDMVHHNPGEKPTQSRGSKVPVAPVAWRGLVCQAKLG